MNNPGKSRPRVLVAEDVESIASLMKHILGKNGYAVEVASDGEECLAKILTFKPALVILDILMPKLHGLDALKKIRADQRTRETGVIVCSSKNYKPDQDQARSLGVFDFIEKPFQHEVFLNKVNEFFNRPSSARSTAAAKTGPADAVEVFIPKLIPSQSHCHLWGTRGSIPVAGQRYIHHGGNTSCLTFQSGEDLVIFDAGTGIRELGVLLADRNPTRLHLFVGHTHWDHIQGFPFFNPVYLPGCEILIYGASGFGKDLKSLFEGQLDRDYFPVQLEDMRAKLDFIHLSQNPVEIGSILIYWEYTHHPGATLGFKIAVNGKKIGYISDNEFLKGYLGHPDKITSSSEILLPYLKLVKFLSDVDFLIGEAQYTNEEYNRKIGWGHSSLSNASLLARLAGVRKWIVTHHDPMHDDEFLQNKLCLHKQLLAEMKHPLELSYAFDGMIEYI